MSDTQSSRARPRVLFVTQEYSPIFGGVGTSAQRLARGLAALGVDVRVATFDSKRPLTEDDFLIEEVDNQYGFHISRVGPFFHGQIASDPDLLPEPKRAEFRRRMFDQILPIARRFQPDVVLSFYALDAGLLGAYLSRSLRVPHIAGVRGNDIGRGMFDHNAIASLTVVMSSSQKIVCVNQYLLERLLLCFPEVAPRTSVIPNAVHLPSTLRLSSSRDYIRSHTTWGDSDLVVVFLGNLREKKGTTVLLDAIAEANERAPVRLLVAGPPPVQSDFLRCGAQWEELSHKGTLHCTGKMERGAALQVVSEGDVLVMPSVDDGMANALLEGMALGLCPVVTDVFTDVVDTSCGFIVQRNSRQRLADAFVLASQSPELRRKLGSEAKQRIAARHRPMDEASAYKQLIEQCA